MRYILTKEHGVVMNTENEGTFAAYLMSHEPGVTIEVMEFGIRWGLAEDNPDPLTELCRQVMSGKYEGMTTGHLVRQGLDALAEDMVDFGANLDETYNYHGIRIEKV